MAGKVYTLRPDVSYRKINTQKREEEKLSFKERIVETFEVFLLLLLFSLFVAGTVGVAYKSFLYFKIKREKNTLLTERTLLEEELKRLTSQEVILSKARTLGLRPPQKEDYLYLK